jgi:hypothetical protein
VPKGRHFGLQFLIKKGHARLASQTIQLSVSRTIIECKRDQDKWNDGPEISQPTFRSETEPITHSNPIEEKRETSVLK